jgi:hypothetical protein
MKMPVATRFEKIIWSILRSNGTNYFLSKACLAKKDLKVQQKGARAPIKTARMPNIFICPGDKPSSLIVYDFEAKESSVTQGIMSKMPKILESEMTSLKAK